MRRTSPAALRNRGPLLEVLQDVLPPAGLVLEVASGSGEHVVFFASALPVLQFQPTDRDPEARASITAHVREANLPNVRAPIELDAASPRWTIAQADAVLCINMIHIAPLAATRGLFAGAARVLPPGAPLLTYGPYRFSGRFTAESNAAFDRSLRAQDPAWGVRDVDELFPLAVAHGLHPERTVALPANNHALVFRRVSPAA